MRVLLYNFQQPDETGLNPGGVGVYMKSIAHELARRGVNVICMSAGDLYEANIYANRLEISKGPSFTRVRVVNSPVVAPSYANFFAQNHYLNSDAMNWIPQNLRSRLGDIDVFHFQNIEGLTLGFFNAVRQEFTKARIILSAHNYNVVCPQVNLWQNEKRNCIDYRSGEACVTCTAYIDAEFQKRWRAADRYRTISKKRPWSRTDRYLEKHFLPSDVHHKRFWEGEPQAQIDTETMSPQFREYRKQNAALCKSLDRVLATSHRTKTVLCNKGLTDQNIRVCYIGSNAVKSMIYGKRKTFFSGRLRLAYFGYVRRDKGFYFLINALKQASPALRSSIELVLAARWIPQDVIEDIGDLGLGGLKSYFGYDAASFVKIVEGVDLGVVPHLWEDNLPQVAIELVAAGLPILVSDLGGAAEIANNPKFQFEGGSVASFLTALEAIASRSVSLAEFWEAEPNVRTMETHVDELMQDHYC